MAHDDDDFDPTTVMVLSEKGRQVLKDDTQMSIENRLYIEIASRMANFTANELDSVYDQLVEIFEGNVDAAFFALKNNLVEWTFSPAKEE